MTNAVRSTDFPADTGRRLDLRAIEAWFIPLGCVPSFRLMPLMLEIGARSQGGFFLLCNNGSKVDLAGRLLKNVPNPTT